MSKNINVNPDHYKVAGRERQGEDVVQKVHRRRLAKTPRDRKAGPPGTGTARAGRKKR